MKTKVLLRGDGHNRMGIGHVVRLIALSKVLRTEFECHFAIRKPSLALRTLIQGNCRELIELPEENNLLAEARFLHKNYLEGNEIVVLDGYHFQTDYQRVLKSAGCKVVCIDDLHDAHFAADAIINHAGGVRAEMYSAEPNTRFCLGLEYAVLRQPFLAVAGQKRQLNSHPIAFICLGGADPNNDTLTVLKQCEKVAHLRQCYVVLGSEFRQTADLEAFIKTSRLDIQLLHDLCPEKMVSIMRLCPIAVCTPSTIAIEYLSVGGALYLHQTADNQQDILNYLLKKGLAFPLKELPADNPSRRNLLFTRQRKELDGRSGERLLNLFRELDYERHCQLRKAEIEDMMLYFHWGNSPSSKEKSLNLNPLNLSEHKHWFSKKIFDSHSFLYLLEYKNKPIGQICFELNGKVRLNYSIEAPFLGKGLGAYLLENGLKQLRKDSGQPLPLEGLVPIETSESKKDFLNPNFRQFPSKELEKAEMLQLDFR